MLSSPSYATFSGASVKIRLKAFDAVYAASVGDPM
jgi:hypothetical protein